MPDKRSKYDTDPLDPDFLRRTEEISGRTQGAPFGEETEPLRPPSVTEEPTRRFDEQISDAYPSVFVPPAYEPPRQPQPFTTFGAGPHQPPAAQNVPPPGPSTPYGPHAAGPSTRTVAKLGLPENVANALPYAPFWIGFVAALVELVLVPRHETRARYHAAQGLALQLAIIAGTVLFQVVGSITGARFGGTLFWVASLVFLIVSTIRVYKGEPHHITPLDDATKWLDQQISPLKK
ncbi:MAG TPA: hypothetical protein VK422_22145 [Pyrinomonadaceae bacterium]|nr:hypothetical protein [Pyrinomonadaceae bacterium]